MATASEQPGFLKLDFVQFFPHKFWVSDWGADDAYPEGFRYKLLSARDEHNTAVELVLLLESADGTKQEMHRAHVKLAALDGYARVFVDGLASKHGLEFEAQDLSGVRTAAEFELVTAGYGWSEADPDA